MMMLLMSTIFPACRALLTDDLVGSSAVSLGAAVSVVGRISINHMEGARGKGNRVSACCCVCHAVWLRWFWCVH